MPDPLKHLLLVEDEAPLRQAIAEQLGDRGYQVEQAGSGEEALAHLADFAFDIIVTDLRLPGIDGSAVIEAAVARYPLIIAIVVTGFGTVKVINGPSTRPSTATRRRAGRWRGRSAGAANRIR